MAFKKAFFYILIFFFIGLIKFVLRQHFTLHKPIGHMPSERKDWFTGKFSAYERSLEVAKKLHMVEPIGNTAFLGRERAVKS